MRSHVAMADGYDPVSAKTVLTWLSGLATATIGGAGLWLAQRVLGKAAFQTAINDGFSKLTQELQEERDRLRSDAEVERVKLAAERIAWSEERFLLKGRIRQLEQQVQGLEERLGIEPVIPREAEAGATEL